MARIPNKKKITLKRKKKKSQVSEFNGSNIDNDKPKGNIISIDKGVKDSNKSSMLSYQPKFIEKSLQFFREVKVELKKVTWPSRSQTTGSTVVVIILVLIISFFLGIVDIGLSNIARLIY